MVEGVREHRELASVAAHIQADYHGRFLIELLQNASDQAALAGLTKSTVAVVRTPGTIAVANEGLPFSDRGIRALSEVGLSPKDVTVTIGNKGLGFKSVFEVTEAPEIYSASAPNLTFTDQTGARLRFSRRPFENASFEARIAQIIAEELALDEQLAERLRTRLGPALADALLGEVRVAPPFRFPLPVEPSQFESCIRLFESTPQIASAQTLVVLPLKEGQRTGVVVEAAIREVLGEGGSVLLFLPSVDRVVIVDEVLGRISTVERDERVVAELPRAMSVSRARTRLLTRGAETAPSERKWWVLRRTMGGDGSDAARAEGEALRSAVLSLELPGEGWDQLREATVAVALQEPSEASNGAPLDADGLFSVGLPTLVRTGTPFWVDARFHASISRKELDLDGSEYNRLLYAEAVALCGELLDHLKAGDLKSRRAVTQAMHFREGPLARSFQSENGLATGDVVLSVDGSTFIRATSLALPYPEDTGWLWQFAMDVDPSGFGFVLAERALVDNARTLLEALAPKPPHFGHDDRFVRRPASSPTFVECAALVRRLGGPKFWEPFLSWLLERFPLVTLEDQHVLPVGTAELAAATQRVFLRPRFVEDDEVLETNELVASLLRFIDENAVPMRRAGDRDLADLGRALSPVVGGGLVRRPRREDLINDALAPRLREAVVQNNRAAALALLSQGAEWLVAMKPDALGRVYHERLLVPVTGENGRWSWEPPTSAYFGSGWIPDRETLLAQAFGKSPARRVVPWTELASEVGSDPSLDLWRAAFERMGVRAAPHLLTWRHARPPLRAWNYTNLWVEPGTSPVPEQLAEFWNSYIEYVARRPVGTKSGRAYDVKELAWLDGLDGGETRTAAFELALLDPNHYLEHASTEVARLPDLADSRAVDAFWVQALKEHDWPVVPTSRGYLPPSQAWYLEPSEMRQARLEHFSYGLLPYVLPAFHGARDLLLAVGVTTLEDAPANRIIRALQDLASALGHLDEAGLIGAQALASDLYRRLGERCRTDPVTDVSSLLGSEIPLLRARRLVSVELSKVEQIYFDDDSQRSGLLERTSGEPLLFLPVRRRDSPGALIEALERLLGTRRVIRASQAPIETGFRAGPGAAAEPLRAYLARLFPEVPVLTDLLCLYCYGPGREPRTSDDETAETCRRIGESRVVEGTFPNSLGEASILDRDVEGSILMISVEPEPTDRVAATWPIFGADLEDTWNVYSQALAVGRTREFLRRRQIGTDERAAIDEAVGRPERERLLELRDLLCGVWRTRHRGEPVALFLIEFEDRRSSADELAAWLNVPRALLGGSQPLEDRAQALLAATGVDASEWQSARRELGLPAFTFAQSILAFEDARSWLVAGLKAVASRHVGSLGEMRRALEEI